jgi:hypothetical protein
MFQIIMKECTASITKKWDKRLKGNLYERRD